MLRLSPALGLLVLAQCAVAAEQPPDTTDKRKDASTLSALIVTAEKREQKIQQVPVAISAFTAAKRQLIGIDNLQEMADFTPGLEYNGSADRISLRGVGRLTNVLSADSAVATYSDGVYETFAVGAGASTLYLDRVEVLRGPQGTLYGRNSIGGAINIVSRRPTSSPYAEVRATWSNYDHGIIEGAVSGPITNRIQGRLAGSWEKQSRGWIRNIVPGLPDEGNVINQVYLEGQLRGWIGDRVEAWIKVGFNQWNNGAGGPGAQSAGWTPSPFEINEWGNGSSQPTPGYGCTGIPSAVVNPSPLGCVNPARTSPWLIARTVPFRVFLPFAYTIAAHLTYQGPGYEIKYITGGVNYHYQLTGPSGGNLNPGYLAPVTAYTLPGGLAVAPQESFNYQERNAFWSHEINLVSTDEGKLQWLAGAYWFRQHYDQPIYTTNPGQPELNGPFFAPAQFCNRTGGVCPPATLFRRYDSRPAATNLSEALFGQIDWQARPWLKTTFGARYSRDGKSGSESVRLLCLTSNCYGFPVEILGARLPVVDLTQFPLVTSNGLGPGGPPPGVLGPTTYDAKTGLATRYFATRWSGFSGTAGVEATPDADTLVYLKYSRGYRAGGFNIGIFTTLNAAPRTNAERLDAFELGLKKTWFGNITTDIAAFYYRYYGQQLPITVNPRSTNTNISPSFTAFYNVPSSISRGVELEATWQPTRNLSFLLDYSYLDAYIQRGAGVDDADPTAIASGAQPLPDTPATPWVPDIYTGGQQKEQNLRGQRLPNAPRNKFAVNANYNWNFEPGWLNASVSYIWRDAQYGAVFTRFYNRAPAWDQIDARLTWSAADGRYRIIAYGKNIFNGIGYDAGAYGTRLAGSQNGAFPYATRNFVQSPGIGSTYSVNPPRTYGLEVDYRF